MKIAVLSSGNLKENCTYLHRNKLPITYRISPVLIQEIMKEM